MTAAESRGAPQRVLILGFGDFERQALDSYIRLSSERQPHYRQVSELSEADFVIVDADDPHTMEALRVAGRLGDSVVVGASYPMGALAWVMRPVDPHYVFRAVDAAYFARHVKPEADSGRRSAAPATQPVESNPKRRASDKAMPCKALIVDDSVIAQRFLQKLLHELGLQTECAFTSADALEILGQSHYDAVFLDLDLGPESDLNGLALCQRLKKPISHDARAQGVVSPRVVIVSAHHSATDRVRGTFAGCDAYLPKPIDDTALRETLLRLGLWGQPGPARHNKGRRKGEQFAQPGTPPSSA